MSDRDVRAATRHVRSRGFSLDYSRSDRFEQYGARFEFTLQCVFEDKLKLEL